MTGHLSPRRTAVCQGFIKCRDALTLGLHLCSRSTRWGPARGRSGCPCPGPCAPGVRGEAGAAAGQRLAREARGLPDRDPAGAPGRHEEQDAVGGELGAWSACQKRTDRRRQAPARHHLRGRESDGASLGAQPGLGFHVSPALPSVPPPAPTLRPGARLCLLPALVWVCHVWTLEGVCWPNSGGSRVPSHHGGDGALLGRVLPRA